MESDIQKVVNHYFHTKGLSLDQIKDDSKKQKIIYMPQTLKFKKLHFIQCEVAKEKKKILQKMKK